MSGNDFDRLSDDVLFSIFKYLKPYGVLQAAQCCLRWKRVALDDLLWRDLVKFTFKIPPEGMLLPENAESWYSEFKRLYYHTPCTESEVLRNHRDEVLHVGFSHDGKYFATSSKDGTIKLWELGWPTVIKHERNMADYSWGHVMLAEFNQSDTYLLVSGVKHQSQFNGQVAIIDINDGFRVVRQVDNRPYDVFGIWLDNENIIAGKFYWWPYPKSELFVNKTYLSKSNSHLGDGEIEMKLASFQNQNENCIRVPVIACCDADTICKNDQQTERESSSKRDSDIGNNSSFPSREESESESYKHCDKYLIYWTGEVSCVPNQLGIKRFSPDKWLQRIDQIQRRRIEKRQSRNRNPSHPSDEESEDSDFSYDSDYDGYSESARADPESIIRQADHKIDFNGRIIGAKLSRDHKYLFVNVRAWPEDFVIDDPLSPPEISDKIEIHVVDLTTMTDLGVKFTGHKGHTTDAECFLMYIDTCDQYIASGSEDNRAYLWDRHYRILLQTLPSDDVVSGAAFNPRDPETIVTVSDDFSVRVFRSRNRHREVNIGTSMDVGSGNSFDPIVEQFGLDS